MQLFERNQVGKRESLADLIACVEAAETPFTSMLAKRKKPNQVLHDWQVKAYPVTGHKGVMDGKDATEFNHNPRERLHAVAQKTWFNPGVSDFAEEADVAGIPEGEMAAQIADALITVKRQIEKRNLSSEDCKTDDGVETANETRGGPKWIQAEAQATYPVPAKFRTPAANIFSGALSTFTEQVFEGLMASSYKQRKGPSKVDGFLGVDMKKKFTGFTIYTKDENGSSVVRRFNQDADSQMLIRTIDKLVMDTGEVDLHLNAFMYTDPTTGEDTAYTHRSGLFLDMRMWGIAWTRMPRVVRLEYKGGGWKAIVDAIFMLMCDNPLGHLKAESNAD